MNGKVLISGAGVAGLALAYWLDRAGFATTLVERSPEFRRGGQAVDIRGVALSVVNAMQLLDTDTRHTQGQRAKVIVFHGLRTQSWLFSPMEARCAKSRLRPSNAET